ncbi:MAG: DUF885 domain-containing protein [Verrucomicrobia bacterium]|nr:DUF885 domain-containing protein [Verrucomicrobiota bacterium]
MKLLRLFALLAAAAAPLFATDAAFDKWADDLTAETMRANPNWATVTQYFTGAEQDTLDRQLTPITKAYRLERVAKARTALAELAKFDRTKLDAEQRISAGIIGWSLQLNADAETYNDYNFVFGQFGGLHVSLVNFLSQTHPIRNHRDIENYLARLGLVAAQMDEGIAQAKDAASRGFLMPDFITKASLGQFAVFLGDAPAKNVLVASLEERAAKLKDVTPEERAKLVGAAEQIVASQIIPAFRRAQALLQEQLPHTTSEAGLWRLPGGDKAYAYALRKYTTTTLTPDEIHALGRKEVARIEAKMDSLLKQLGYANGTIKERMLQLGLSLQPPASPDPRAALLKRFDDILADALKRSESVFDVRPKAPCIVKREPPFTEKTAAAHYTGPAKDGSRPGVFWAPLPGPTFDIAAMRTLVYHEAIPGHHFQIALQRETASLPRYRRDGIFGGGSAYAEGWALYAEQLATECHWYDGDVVGQLGQLDAELFRARRLVVDTGLHAKHWTRQQAIDYGIIGQEVDRYVTYAGQACSYKVGQLKILALRAKAKAALGDKFDLKKFHNVVLQSGNMPLAVLEQVVDSYISESR